MRRADNQNPAKALSRRDALSLLGSFGVGALVTPWSAPLVEAALPQEPGDPLVIAGRLAELTITPVTPYMLRISVLPLQKDGSVQPIKPSAALLPTDWPEPAAKIRTLTRPQPRSQFRPQTIPWGNLQIRLLPEPLTILVQGRRGRIIPRLRFDLDDASVSFDRGVAPVYGLGEGGPQFDRGGQEYPMGNGQSVPGLDVLGARMPIPWVVGASGWGLFFHQPYGTFDLRSAHRFVPSPSAPALPLDFFLVTSEDPADILKGYAQLTGLPHLPPIWSLGYQQSHRTLSSR